MSVDELRARAEELINKIQAPTPTSNIDDLIKNVEFSFKQNQSNINYDHELQPKVTAEYNQSK
jgi:hypothetical protein